MLGKIITIWSVKGNMGTTINAINLAKEMAKKKRKTLLLDMNFFQPRVAQYLKLDPSIKTIDNIFPYATGEKPLSKEILEDNTEMISDSLYVLKGTINPNIVESDDKGVIFKNILNTARESFDYIFIDTNSYLNCSSTYNSLNEADLVLTLVKKSLFNILSLYDIKNALFSYFDINKFKILFTEEDKNIYMTSKEVMEYLDMKTIGGVSKIEYLDNYINRGDFNVLQKNKVAKKYFSDIEKICEKIRKQL